VWIGIFLVAFAVFVGLRAAAMMVGAAPNWLLRLEGRNLDPDRTADDFSKARTNRACASHGIRR